MQNKIQLVYLPFLFDSSQFEATLYMKKIYCWKSLILARMSLKKDLNTMFNAEVLQGTVGPNEKQTTGSSN